mmetsp:Transcript_29890/g.61459  ORF Transcript_29890/g.61459 Transcript_29890/m.61459 type:complete len:480 (-) Transcript_29890:392-1831(-)
MSIPTVTKDGEPLLLALPGPSILHKGANGLLLAHGPMQRAGFTINLRSGNKHNPRDGGFLRIPDGRVINLTFENDLYYLPVHTPVNGNRVKPLRSATPAPALQPSDNPFQLLQNDSADPSACYWTAADIGTSHKAWCHPGVTKTDAIIATYPDLFPKDPAYRAAARQHRCPVCDLMKGSRKYRKSARMKAKAKAKNAKHAEHCKANSVLTSVQIPAIPHCTASMCAEHREEKTKRVRFSAETSTRSRLADDDFLHAFQAPACLKGEKREVLAQHVLHIDHAHTLSLGYKGQRYYLVMVIDGVDFLWASSSKHKSNPEALLEEFLRYTNVKVDKLPELLDEELTESDEDEEPFSTPPTQPRVPVCSPKSAQQQLPIPTPTPPSPTPESASLDVLSDKQLGRAVVHHKMILDCQVVKPDSARREGQILQLPVGTAKRRHTLHLRRLYGRARRYRSPRARSAEPPSGHAPPSTCPLLEGICG